MRRESFSEKNEEVDSPIPFVDFQIVNGVFKDVISNTAHYGDVISNNNGYVYNADTKHRVYFNIPLDGVLNYVYPNQNYLWSGGATPNPPVNGVCPEYFGEGLRLVATLYCADLVADPRANGSAIIACLSHNNSDYVGFNVSMKDNISSFYLNRYLVYSAPDTSVGPITIVQNANAPMKIQIDMSPTYYRIKLFEYGSTTAVGDSGLQSANFGASSKRLYPLTTSNAGQAAATYPTVYVQSYQYYKESALTDFLL